MANLNLNKVVLAGRITKDLEVKQTPSGASVCSFSLAINRKYSKEGEQATDFITCQAWRGTAEFIGKYFHKGSAICVTGSIQTRSWKDKDGNNRYATEVIVDEAMFVDGKNDQAADNTAPYIPDAYKTPATPNFQDMPQDDDLPF